MNCLQLNGLGHRLSLTMCWTLTGVSLALNSSQVSTTFYVKKEIINIMPAKSKDLIPEKGILKIIIVIRWENVILDSDPAKLYDV